MTSDNQLGWSFNDSGSFYRDGETVFIRGIVEFGPAEMSVFVVVQCKVVSRWADAAPLAFGGAGSGI